MKHYRWAKTCGVIAVILSTASFALAKGRKPSYVTTRDRRDIQPVRRGSPANPNAAFEPPRFDNDIPQAVERPRTPERQAPPASANPAHTASREPAAAPPANASVPPPNPEGTVTTNSSEPALPDEGTPGR
jgi:hypothetical protein